MAAIKNLSVCTYNMRGFNVTKVDYLKQLLVNCDILFIQEHWLNPDQIALFANYFPQHSIHGISALNSGVLLEGRPHGGCIIVYGSHIAGEVQILKTDSKRLCATTLTLSLSICIYMFCIYMPCDVNTVDNLEEYEDVLNEVSSIITNNNALYVCIAGDLNTDFSRATSWHTRSLNNFIEHECLTCGSDFSNSHVDYSYCNIASNSFSTLDHFIISKSLFDYINEYRSLCGDVDNQSDHSAIIMSLSLNVKQHAINEQKFTPRKCWNKADWKEIENYKINLERNLSYINIPHDCITCTNYLCNNVEHLQRIQIFHDELIAACISASSAIPDTSNNKNKGNVPGWNDHVKQYKQAAVFWRNMWHDNGSPREGTVANIMRRTRARYHYAIRHVKSKKEQLKKQSMALSISQKNSRNLWKETSRVRNNACCNTNCIDGITGDVEISKHFAEKYNDLYNSVTSDKHSLDDIFNVNLQEILTICNNPDIVHSSNIHTHVINVEQIMDSVAKLKLGKSDCSQQIFSDNIINGTHRLYVYISLLFSCMLVHGSPPAGLLLSTIVPIPKDKRGNRSNSGNYRAIALGSLFCKMFDNIVLSKHYDNLMSDELQFGYKKGASTVLCTALLKETIDYYAERDSDCYMLMLDASKAFDRVEYVRLFTLLRERALCPVVLRLIMNMYVNQCIQIKWNSMISEKYGIANGVKQGGVLSPILFGVYMDNLIKRLKDSNVGCKIGNNYVGVFCYADDLTLISPTLTGLKCMLSICENYADEYKILFNASKSQLLHFTKCNTQEKITVKMKNNKIIESTDKCVYLGIPLHACTLNNDMTSTVRDFNRKVNNLLADFSFVDSNTLSVLFDSYCMSIYGSQLFKLYDKNSVNCIYVAWRKAIRKIWKIPNISHCRLLPYINDCNSMDSILERRCIRFLYNIFNSESQLYTSMIKYSLTNCDSTLGENIRYMMHKYKFDMHQWYGSITLLFNKIDLYNNSHTVIEDKCTGMAIRELCNIKDGIDYLPFVSNYKAVIESMCIN